MTKTYHSNIPAAYLVLQKEGKVLLHLRQNTGFRDGEYGLVSGHVEPGEPFTAAAIREAKEEAGITIHPEHLTVAHIMHRKSDDSERVDTFFVVDTWEGDIVNTELHKCKELAWFDMTDLPHNTIDYLKEVLMHIQEGKRYSEYGW